MAILDGLSIVVLVILVILLITTVIFIPSAIIFNLKVGLRYRARLARQLDQLRIGKMLGALGIDITEYLHQEPTNSIREQITRCSECTHTEQCDEHLDRGDITADTISYCNNESALHNITTRKKQELQP